jgi:murein DD-endopeptidase MepM/ murein hydrolase activator NlpD
MAERALHHAPDTPNSRRRRRMLAAAGLTAAALALPLAAPPAALAQGPSTTLAAASATKYPTIRYGSEGPAVKRLQKLLHVKPVSGWFGPITKAAVMRFEKRHHLKVNGIVGKPTWRAILRAHAASTSTSRSKTTSGRACPVPGASFSDTYGAARSGHGHAGVDMLAKKGTKIHAIESGTVVRAHWSGSSGGYTITLQGRSGSKFFMAHNSKNLVKAGQRVTVNQVIALVGSTGNAGTVNHLHFEYWKSGRESDPVNPTPLIRSLCS